jgi:hypothetical protein
MGDQIRFQFFAVKSMGSDKDQPEHGNYQKVNAPFQEIIGMELDQHEKGRNQGPEHPESPHDPPSGKQPVYEPFDMEHVQLSDFIDGGTVKSAKKNGDTEYQHPGNDEPDIV